MAMDLAVVGKLERSDARATRGTVASNGILGDSVGFVNSDGSPLDGATRKPTNLAETLELLISKGDPASIEMADKLTTAQASWDTSSEQLREDRAALNIGTDDLDRIDDLFLAARSKYDVRKGIVSIEGVSPVHASQAEGIWEVDAHGPLRWTREQQARDGVLADILKPMITEVEWQVIGPDAAPEQKAMLKEAKRQLRSTDFKDRDLLAIWRDVVLYKATDEQRQAFDNKVGRLVDTSVLEQKEEFTRKWASKRRKAEARTAARIGQRTGIEEFVAGE
jgi:hypothetical protein